EQVFGRKTNDSTMIGQLLLARLVGVNNHGRAFAAVLEIADRLCRPEDPRCPDCPLRLLCSSGQGHLEPPLPLPPPPPDSPASPPAPMMRGKRYSAALLVDAASASVVRSFLATNLRYSAQSSSVHSAGSFQIVRPLASFSAEGMLRGSPVAGSIARRASSTWGP